MKLAFATLLKKTWHSPTFTSWGNQCAQALRLLAVTPLILVSFNTTEIAAWYLFGSLTFIGTVISQRIGLTFSRMISFAMGGATDLSPIKDKPLKRDNTAPNWPLIERAYATTGLLNLCMTIVVTLSALGVGYYGLENLLANYPQKNSIWLAFGMMVVTQSAVFFSQQYSVALRGMNYVALINRWNVVFSLVSIIAGFTVLKCGGGIVAVTVAMQTVIILSIPWFRCVLRTVEMGRFKSFRSLYLDRQILGWAWEPAWKGFAVTLANSGSLQVAALFSARHLAVTEAAAALLSLRLLTSLKSVSDAPVLSHMPTMAKFWASGEVEKIQNLVQQRLLFCQVVFSIFILGLAFIGPILLDKIGSNANLLDQRTLLILGLLFLLKNFQELGTMISASGNHIVCVSQAIWAAALTAIALYLFIPSLGIPGLLAGLFLPSFLIINIAPMRIAAEKMNIPLGTFTLKSNALPLSALAIAILISILQ